MADTSDIGQQMKSPVVTTAFPAVANIFENRTKSGVLLANDEGVLQADGWLYWSVVNHEEEEREALSCHEVLPGEWLQIEKTKQRLSLIHI